MDKILIFFCCRRIRFAHRKRLRCKNIKILSCNLAVYCKAGRKVKINMATMPTKETIIQSFLMVFRFINTNYTNHFN